MTFQDIIDDIEYGVPHFIAYHLAGKQSSPLLEPVLYGYDQHVADYADAVTWDADADMYEDFDNEMVLNRRSCGNSYPCCCDSCEREQAVTYLTDSEDAAF